MSNRRTIFISLAILLASAAVTVIVFFTEPEAKREAATKRTAMLVEVTSIERSDYRPTVVATGSVQAAKDITLSPRVGGEIVRVSESFTPGSTVRKGEMLLQIDPSDYRNTLQLRKSDLQLAKSALRVEMGRQDVAQKDYELIGDDLSVENQALVLREPQLESARATVEAAEAAVRQAELNLQRTTIRAPFDAHVISRNANEGSQVAPGNELGRLVGVDEYWVVANVPVSKISWLSFGTDSDDEGSEVKIVNENSWPPGAYRTGRLYRLVGALNAETRLARVLVTVADPLAVEMGDTVPPLMIGTFVETHIQAREIEDVIRLKRDHLRKDETVWVMEDGKLRIKEVDILFEDPQYAYVSEGLSDNDQIVTTNLSTVVEGSELRTEGMTATPDSTELEEVVHN